MMRHNFKNLENSGGKGAKKNFPLSYITNMGSETTILDGFAFAHGNVFERARAIFGRTGNAFWPGEGKRYPEPSEEELTWIRKETDLYNEEIDKFLALKKQQRDLANKSAKQLNLGAREFTLTYSPKWFGDDEARTEMIKAINKLIKYYKDEIIQLRAVGEVGTNGLSHVHCFYKLQGGIKMTDKNFKRAWKYWNPKKILQRGFEGGHHATVRNESDFIGYIDKDIDTAWLDKTFPCDNNIKDADHQV